EAKVGRLTSPKKRGRPRDAYADAFSQVRGIAELSLQGAIAEAVVTLPPGILTTCEEAEFRTRLRQTFAVLLAETMNAAGLWHYKHRRKLFGEPARAMRDAARRRRKEQDGS